MQLLELRLAAPPTVVTHSDAAAVKSRSEKANRYGVTVTVQVVAYQTRVELEPAAAT